MATDPDGEIIGLASYHRSQATPAVAEAAVVVVAERHGAGLGTALLETLVRDARSRGVQTFRNYILSEDHRLLDITWIRRPGVALVPCGQRRDGSPKNEQPEHRQHEEEPTDVDDDR